MTPEIKQRIEQIRRGEVPEGYVKTALGLAPANWKRYTFGDIYTERKEPGDENLPLLMVSIHSGVSDGEVDAAELPKQVKRIEDKSQYKKAVSGDLVFNMMRAWQGAIGTVRTTGMVSPAYIVAEPNDKAYPLFMDYYSRTPQMINQIDRQSYGVTDFRKRLYWDSFAPIGCILPPIEEQQKIAAILTTQDKVIELKEKRLAEKQRQKKYLMHRFFVDANGKKIRLGQIANVIMGQSPSSTSYNGQMEGMPLIQGNGDIEGRNTHPRMYTTQPTKICKKGDILISVRAPVGSVSRSSMNACIGRGMCAVDAGIYQNYVYQYLIYFEGKWGKVSQGSTFESISGDEIRKLKTLIPDNMQHIEKILSTADREIELLQQDIEQEKQKKKALMQLLLTGIVRVKT